MGESAMTRGHQPLSMGQTLVVAVSPQRELVLLQYSWTGLDANPVVGKHSPANFKLNLLTPFPSQDRTVPSPLNMWLFSKGNGARMPYLWLNYAYHFSTPPAHVQYRHLVLVLQRCAGQEPCGCLSVLSRAKLHEGGDQVGVIVIQQLHLL